MASLAIQTLPAAWLANPAHGSPVPQRRIRALVVSPKLEVRRALLRTLEALPADVIACSSRTHAEGVLSNQVMEIVFCDAHLPDGLYSDLIHPNHWERRIPRVVVTTVTGDWNLRFEALRKGGFDVLRCPWYATDVELTIILALREEDQVAFFHAVA